MDSAPNLWPGECTTFSFLLFPLLSPVSGPINISSAPNLWPGKGGKGKGGKGGKGKGGKGGKGAFFLIVWRHLA